MARRFDAKAALADILGDFPPGWFDNAEPLLRAYIAKLAEHDALLERFDEARAAGDDLWAISIFDRANTAFDEALDMAAGLGVLPGDKPDRRPVLQ